MINYIFQDIGSGFGLSLFADIGAIWKGDKNNTLIIEKIQVGLKKIKAGGLRYWWKNQNS